jgi:hypothetical protein
MGEGPLSRTSGNMQARIQRVGGPCPPALDHQILFVNYILWTLFTLISYLKIVQQAVKLPRASHSNSI